MDNKGSYANYVRSRMSVLKDHDHGLFDDVVNGLRKEGWLLEGGSNIFAILFKRDSAIKIFRNEDSPGVIRICFSAPPEEPNTVEN